MQKAAWKKFQAAFFCSGLDWTNFEPISSRFEVNIQSQALEK